ncbi:MAG: hypothetical protein IJM85_07120, partial [Clostridia bacterium]|nr:hypothetical protein [Clostridia bacterium]
VYSEYLLANVKFISFLRDTLKLENACSEVISSQLTQEDIDDILGYEEPSQEELDLRDEEYALEQEFETIDHTTYTTVIDGEEYDADDVYDAFMTYGTITLEQYLKGCHECYGAYGDLYLRMIEVRNRIAELNGYDNYAEYAYVESYNRDYTIEEIAAFREAVKTYLAPQLVKFRSMLPGIDQSEFPLDESAYSGEEMFSTLAPLFGQMSDELLETLTHVHDQHFYDISAAEEKADRGYSWMISNYNMPFYYNYPYGYYEDLLTTIHETGHNNKAYWSPNGWADPSIDIDTAEVHSQGLELLMTHYYGDLFGSQADAVAARQAYSVLSAITSGCLHDEIQCYAYSTPDVTFEMICQKYRQLAEEYSNVSSSDPRPEMYGWTSIHHTFNSPMYYISYATSAAGAFMFWEEAQNDFLAAVDHYLAFCAQSSALGFEETFEAVGLESPLSPEYIEKLSNTMYDNLFIVNSYTDVHTDAWYAYGVYFSDYYELIDPDYPTVFNPEGTITRGRILTALARFADERDDAPAPYIVEEGVDWAVENGLSDGKKLADAMTREQLAELYYRFAKYFEVDAVVSGDLDSFSDCNQVSDSSRTAFTWAIENDVLDIFADDAGAPVLDPKGTVTRGEFAVTLYNFYLFLIG